MTKQEFKSEIEKQASEDGISVIELITKMQAICSEQENEKMLQALCVLKRDYIIL